MLTDRTNSTNTETPTSFNQKSEKKLNQDGNKNYLAPDAKVKKLHQKLIKFIIACNLPFNITDSDDFQELIDAIKDEYYKLPCRQTLRHTLLPEMFTAMQNMLKLELNRLRFTCITTDVWTSNSQMAYLGITVHYVHSINFFMHKEDHDKDYLNMKLKLTLENWNIENKVIAIVSDSASNMKSALSLFNEKILNFPCSAHKLNSATKFDTNAFIEYFVHLMTSQRETKKYAIRKKVKLVKDVCTRWNSLYSGSNEIVTQFGRPASERRRRGRPSRPSCSAISYFIKKFYVFILTWPTRPAEPTPYGGRAGRPNCVTISLEPL
ncbi:zinc finger BED domain-containing 1-like [Brachionus plicatilis]|uniref:Zinc finger BED domain-containing 1-like n=1 Tax=Brachionus plicatilis TaxID=10195 RepID=A0A3M7SJY7_BRAPC|nr:zinc finger BED domain-containing 1-like [Brachionus plicatilis]